MSTFWIDDSHAYCQLKKGDDGQHEYPLSEEGRHLVWQWMNTEYPSDRVLSGVLADYLEERSDSVLADATPDAVEAFHDLLWSLRKRMTGESVGECLTIPRKAPT